MKTTSRRLIAAVLVALMGSLFLAPLAVPAAAQDARRAEITRIDYEFDRIGVHFFIDATLYNLRGQEVYASIWFQDSAGNYLTDAGQGGDYEDDYGNLVAWDLLKPCCDTTEYSRGSGHTIALFVPYSEFPSVDYHYTYSPYVAIQVVEDGATLASEWLDGAIQVNGADDPYGYQVWLSIRGITADDVQEDGFLEDGVDELMLTYALSEITPEGYAGSFDVFAWQDTVRSRQAVGDGPFSWLYVNVAATSNVVLWLELVEVDDYSAAREYVGAVNTVLGTLSLVATPFTLAPPYAAGITLAAFVSGVADLSVNLIALLDPNDLFMSPQEVLLPSNLRGIAATGEPWDSYYRYTRSGINYTVDFSVYVLPYYRQRPAE